MDTKDVKDPEPSAGEEQEEVEQQPEGAVIPQATDDRPEKNIAMEFNRKFGKLQSQLDTVLNYIATQQQPKPEPKPESKELSDEELWTLAQQGDRSAYIEHQRRIADRQYRQNSAVDQVRQRVQSQLQALIARYPVLNDGQHPLTQKATLAYQAMVAQGSPQSPETLLDATKTAIADSPELIAELQGAGASMTTRSQPAAAQSGASHRQAAPQPQNKPKVLTPEQMRIAKAMGVKDPQGSKARFLKRQQDGTSNFGSIGMVINAEDV